ncbi:hypothetical protein [Maribellus sediminis]|uniref:hypothetical protein n=1 Tax=Maribellus sediminis TaxID=2696285 RepID=UPI001430EDAB|nr:hypothetical protein [Maribellus sediminis]
MKRVVVIMMVVFVQLSCSQKQEEPKEKPTYYFLFEKPWIHSTTSDYLHYKYPYVADSIQIKERKEMIEAFWQRKGAPAKFIGIDTIPYYSEVYDLRHKIGIDTVFVKDTSYLDSISYYNAQFFKDTVKVRKFWDGHFRSKDTLQIYLIKREGDSLVFRKVNRFVMPIL